MRRLDLSTKDAIRLVLVPEFRMLGATQTASGRRYKQPKQQDDASVQMVQLAASSIEIVSGATSVSILCIILAGRVHDSSLLCITRKSAVIPAYILCFPGASGFAQC